MEDEGYYPVVLGKPDNEAYGYRSKGQIGKTVLVGLETIDWRLVFAVYQRDNYEALCAFGLLRDSGGTSLGRIEVENEGCGVAKVTTYSANSFHYSNIMSLLGALGVVEGIEELEINLNDESIDRSVCRALRPCLLQAGFRNIDGIFRRAVIKRTDYQVTMLAREGTMH